MHIKGTYTAIVTPFNKEGALDEEGLRANVRFQVAQGIDGIVALGSTGESPTLTTAEKQQVIKICREETPKTVTLLVGVGSYSTQQTLENMAQAEKHGADAFLVVTPYYNKPTQQGLYLHFQALANVSKLPIMVYNVQGRTGQNVQTETLKRIAELPNIIGVKEASGCISQIQNVIGEIKQKKPNFSVISGDDALTYALIALGGDGVISVLSNLLPAEVKKMTDAALAGDFVIARRQHYKLLPLFNGAFIETNPIPIKTMMDHYGMAAGKCRLPLCELQPDNKRKLLELCTFPKK